MARVWAGLYTIGSLERLENKIKNIRVQSLIKWIGLALAWSETQTLQ